MRNNLNVPSNVLCNSNSSFTEKLLRSKKQEIVQDSEEQNKPKYYAARNSNLKQQSNLLSNISNFAHKENVMFGILNNSLNSERKRNEIRIVQAVQDLQAKKRHHSQQLLSQFHKQIEIIQGSDGSQQQIKDRIHKLQIAVDMIKNAREVLNNPQGFDLKNLNKSQKSFVQEQIISLYQCRLQQKQKQARQLKRLYIQLQQRIKRQKQYEKNSLKKSIRRHIEQVHGPSSIKKQIQPHKLSISGRDLFGTSNNLNLSILSNHQQQKQVTNKNQSSFQDQNGQKISNIYNNCPDQPEQLNQIIQWEQQKQPVQISIQKQIPNDVEKGYQTGRFAGSKEKKIKIIGSDQKPHKSRLISTIKLSQIIVCPSKNNQGQKLQNMDAATQTDNQDKQNQIQQQKSQEIINRLRTQTQQTQIHSDNHNLIQPKNQQQFIPRQRILTTTSQIINLTIYPTEIKQIKLSKLNISQQYSLTINTQLIGYRLKSYKSLTKMVIQLLTQSWHLVSKAQNKSNNTATRQQLKRISNKMDNFIKNFNNNYSVMKSSMSGYLPTEQYYANNLKQLRLIEEDLIGLINVKMA